MKAALFTAVFLILATETINAQSDTTAQDSIPNAIREPRMPMKKLQERPGSTVYELPGGMICLTPDSAFHATMPVKKYPIVMRPLNSRPK